MSKDCLVVAPNWVGDTVMALPVLTALADSGRTLTALARPHLHPLLGLSEAVAGIISKEASTAETVRQLVDRDFDEAIVLPNSFRSAWLVYRAGIPRRWGYRGDSRALLLRPAVKRPRDAGHQLRDYDRLLEKMDVRIDPVPPRLQPSDTAIETGTAALARAGHRTGEQPLVGLFAGAEFGPSKRWPVVNFAAAARRLRRLSSRPRPLLIAGPDEMDLAVALHEATDRLFPVLGPDLDLAGLAGLLAQLDLLITNDSGPMHLAAAVGTPCVALFGPTDPGRTAPGGKGHRVLYLNRWCSPCFRRRCPLFHQRCLKEISVDAVVTAAEHTLERKRGTGTNRT